MSAGHRILLVEDDYLVALTVEGMLSDLGHSLTEIIGRAEEAVAAAQAGTFDLALLDLTLGNFKTYPVADLLNHRGIPFAFLTGHDRDEIDPAYAGVPVLHKPFRRSALARIIEQIRPSSTPPELSAS